MATTLRTDTLHDIIALVPYRLGFRPADSVVLVGMRPTPAGRWQMGLVARADIADLADPEVGSATVSHIGSQLLGDGARDVLVVVYADDIDSDRARAEPLETAILTVATGLLWAAGAPHPWRVGDGSFGHLLWCDCCPDDGLDADLLTRAPVLAEAVAVGWSAAPGRDALGVSRSKDAAARSLATAAAARERESRNRHPTEVWRPALSRLWDTAQDVLAQDGPDGPPNIPPELLGMLLVGLEDVRVRDAVLVAALDPAGRRTPTLLDDGLLNDVLDHPVPPDQDRLHLAERLAVAVAAHAAEGAAAPALGLLAFLAWWSGDGARADVLARQALDEDPLHRLASLVLDVLEQALPPGWYAERQP